MKRLIAFVVTILTVLCITACSMPTKNKTSRKNGLNVAFQATVAIKLDRLEAEGTVKRFGDGMWEIEFSSPNTLSGVNLAFNGGNVVASYKGLSFSVPQSALPVKAMMLNLIKVVDTQARLDELNGVEKDGMLEISDKLDSGEYTLIVDKNGILVGFEMPNNKLTMTFTELSEIAVAEQPSSQESSTEETSQDTTMEQTSEADITEAPTETTASVQE